MPQARKPRHNTGFLADAGSPGNRPSAPEVHPREGDHVEGSPPGDWVPEGFWACRLQSGWKPLQRAAVRLFVLFVLGSASRCGFDVGSTWPVL